MEIEYDNKRVERLTFDPEFTGRWNWDIKRKFQKAVIALTAIKRRENLFLLSGMNFELVSGKRKRHRKKDYKREYSIRLDGRWRVVLTFYGPPECETIIVIDVEDYH